MSNRVYLRDLRIEDAMTSHKWRNDKEVWQHTGSRPDKVITPEIELTWLKDVLSRKNEKRFAICLTHSDEYIGNVHLTSIDAYQAEFHIFIGEKKHWRKGYGTEATKLMVDYAFDELQLQCIYLTVNNENVAAVKAYEKVGFYKLIDIEAGYSKMAAYKADRKPKRVSVFMITYNHDAFIDQAIEGILMQQTDFDFEIVIGEDCSDDKTRDILLRYALRNHGLLKLILHGKNCGAKFNQIAVLNACKGRYIAFCEGDDYWTDKHKLQKQIDYLESSDECSLCFHKVDTLKEGNLMKGNNIPKHKNIFTLDDITQSNFIHTCSVVTKSNFVNEFLNDLHKFPVGDYPLFIFLATKGKLGYIDESMATYRIHQNGTWASLNLLNQIGVFTKISDLFVEFFKNNTNYTNAAKNLKNLPIPLIENFVEVAFSEEDREKIDALYSTYANTCWQSRITEALFKMNTKKQASYNALLVSKRMKFANFFIDPFLKVKELF